MGGSGFGETLCDIFLNASKLSDGDGNPFACGSGKEDDTVFVTLSEGTGEDCDEAIRSGTDVTAE